MSDLTRKDGLSPGLSCPKTKWLPQVCDGRRMREGLEGVLTVRVVWRRALSTASGSGRSIKKDPFVRNKTLKPRDQVAMPGALAPFHLFSCSVFPSQQRKSCFLPDSVPSGIIQREQEMQHFYSRRHIRCYERGKYWILMEMGVVSWC